MSEPTIVETLVQGLASRGDTLAYLEKRRGRYVTTTWNELAGEVAQTAAALRALGVDAGHTVANLVANRREWVVVDLATQGCGARSAAIIADGADQLLLAQLSDCRPSLIVVTGPEDAERLIDLYAAGDGARPAIAQVVGPAVESSVVLSAASRDTVDFDRLASDSRAATVLTFSAGSAGGPQPVVHTSAALAAKARAVRDALALTPDDVSVAALPLAHPAERSTTIYPAIVAGSAVAFAETAATIMATVAEVRPTVLHLQALQLRRAVSGLRSRFLKNRGLKRLVHRRWEAGALAAARAGREPSGLSRRLFGANVLRQIGFDQLRFLLASGERLPDEVKAYLRALGAHAYDAYLVTEAGGIVALDGAPAAGAETRAADGHLWVRGLGLAAERAGAVPATADGWYDTGDAGSVADGRVEVVGPAALAIGGIHPSRLEHALASSPYIERAIAHTSPMLLSIDQLAVGDWATREGLSFTTFESLVRLPEVAQLVAGEVARITAGLSDRTDYELTTTPLTSANALTVGGAPRRAGLPNKRSVIV